MTYYVYALVVNLSVRIIDGKKERKGLILYVIGKALYDFLTGVIIDVSIFIVLSNLHLEGEPIAISQSDGLGNCTSTAEMQLLVLCHSRRCCKFVSER